jgi:uncharacterized protein
MDETARESVRDAVYFSRPGHANTARALVLVRERALALGLTTVVVASTSGVSALEAARSLAGLKVVAVSHSSGFKGPGTQEFLPEHRQTLADAGVPVVTTTHVFGGIGRAVRRRFNTYQVDEIIANTLKTLGEGTKVACEVTMMAADAGLVSPLEDVVAVAGTGNGLDTALVLKPAHAQDFFELRIREIICKPR